MMNKLGKSKMASDLRNEIREAVREEVSRLFAGKLQTSTYQGISNVPRMIMLIAIIITLPFQPVRVVPLLAVPVPVQTVQFHNKSVHYPLKSFIKCVNDSVKLGSNQQRKKKGLIGIKQQYCFKETNQC